MLFFAGLLMFGYYYPKMPANMASHFGASGAANGWQSREAFFLLMIIVNGVSAVITFLAPRQITSSPDARINLPNREYWLAAERREGTFAYITSMMAWFGCAVLTVLLVGTYLAIQANLSTDQQFDSNLMLGMMVLLSIFILVLLVRFVSHFRRME